MCRIILIAVLLAFSNFTSALSYTIEITEQELQDKVSAMMPMVKKKFFIAVTVSDPIVDLINESNQIGILVNIKVSAPGGIKGSGKANIKGALIYNKEKGAFYLDNPTIVSMDVDKVSNKFSSKIQKISQLALSKALSRYPVYKFKDDNMKQQLAKAVLESITVENERLLITLSVF